MPVSQVVFLLEEDSMCDFLQAFLPTLGLANLETKYVVFEGKQSLKRQLERKLRGWISAHSQFMVICDQDRSECVELKQELRKLCDQAGKT